MYGNMLPDHIDYNLIDHPLRRLVKAINKSSWARTLSSCAGRAYHEDKGGFHILIEVKGMSGIQNLVKWMSLSHAIGFKACYEEHSIKEHAIPNAEIICPNFLHGKNSVSRPLMGKGWFKFQINLRSGRKHLPKSSDNVYLMYF